MKYIWRIWAKALGEKASTDNTEADKIALIRTIIVSETIIAIIVSIYLITNIVIVVGVVRHW